MKLRMLLLSSLMLTGIFEGCSQFNPTHDWLIKPIVQTAQIAKSADGKDIVLQNGLGKTLVDLNYRSCL